jgi:hypothetical protein
MNISREEAKRCVGPGWSSLIDAIYDRLPEDAFIFQVKENVTIPTSTIFPQACLSQLKKNPLVAVESNAQLPNQRM